jgi:hypothetical protein
VTGRRPAPGRRAAVAVARRFVDAYNAAAAAGDRGLLEPVTTPDAVAGYLVESQSGVVAPLASRTGVPARARLEVDPERAEAPAPGLVIVPFTGHGFPRPDLVGQAEPRLDGAGKVTKVVFHAPWAGGGGGADAPGPCPVIGSAARRGTSRRRTAWGRDGPARPPRRCRGTRRCRA